MKFDGEQSKSYSTVYSPCSQRVYFRAYRVCELLKKDKHLKAYTESRGIYYTYFESGGE